MINKQRLVKTFLDLVEIDSPSGEEKLVRDEVSRRLKKLGGAVEIDAYGNLIAKFEGNGEPLMLNAHLDTVEPGRGIVPIIDGDIIKAKGATIVGGDDKAGVAVILEALIAIKEEKIAHMPLEIVLTLAEEIGLLGAANLDYSKVTAKRGVTFDGEYGVENIDIAAPGYNKVDAIIFGRSAHAGAQPEKGISAIKIASEIITQLQLGRIDEETTANIGLITGGSARNTIPEKVELHGEVRSRNVKKLKAHTKHFEDVFADARAHYKEAKIELHIKNEFGPYHFEKTHAFLQQVEKVYKKLGLQPVLEVSGGGTDVNIFHTHGIFGLVVGAGGWNAHTTREFVKISELVKAAMFCEELIKTL